MTVRAPSDRRFYRRFLLIGLFVTAFALWFLYDGAVTYPRQRERALLMQQLEKEKRDDKWREVFAERGWPLIEPGDPKTDTEIKMQYAMAALTGTIGLWLLSIVWFSRGRWIEGSDTGITSSWGQSLNFDQVVALDKRQWQKKGIAKVTYVDGNRRKRFVLDDFKFQRQPTGEILRELEARIDPDMITGGPMEGALEEQTEEQAIDAEA